MLLKNWFENVVYDEFVIVKVLSFMDVLEQYLLDVIKNFLGKIIFKIEEVNVFDCLFFKDNNYEKRIILWRNLIRKESLMDILYVLNLFGLECYICCLE